MKSPFRLSIAYYPEHWPREEWARDFARIKQAGIDSVRMFEFAWNRMEPEEGHFEFDMLDDAISMAADNGLDVILCTPTEAPPPWMWSAHPDMLPVDVRGLTFGAGSRRHGCPSSDTFNFYSERITEELAKRYGNDPRVTAWQLDNEAGCHVNMRCYCENCQNKFRKWLQKKYKTVDALNQAWGLIFWSGEVLNFDQVYLHHNHLTNTNPGYELDVSRFQSDNWIEFLDRQARIIRKYTKHQAITHNEAWYAEQINGYDLGKTLDFMGVDSYSSSGPQNTLTDEMYYGMKEKPFAIMEMGAGYGASATADGMVLASDAKISMIIRHMMNGAFMCSLWRYRPSPSGGEMDAPMCGLVYHDGTPMPGFYAFEHNKELLQRLGSEVLAFDDNARLISDVHERYPRQYDAAMVLDYDDFLMIYGTPKGRNPDRYSRDILGTDYVQDMILWHSALSANGLKVAVIPPDADFSPYKMIVCHEKWTITEKFAKKLTEYARQGGTVVGADRFGTHVPEGRMSCITLPGYCTELFGVRFYDQMGAQRNPVTLTMPDGETKVGRMLLPLVPEEDTEVLATFRGRDLEGRAGMTRHPMGKGQAFFVGALMEEDGVQLAAKAIARSLQKEAPVLAEENEAVEVLSRGDIYACLNKTPDSQKVKFAVAMRDFMTDEPVEEFNITPNGFLVVRKA